MAATIHIRTCSRKCSLELMRRIYSGLELDNERFHYFLEPDLIIRVPTGAIEKKITEWLGWNKVKYYVYAYPLPEETDEERLGPITAERPRYYESEFVAALIGFYGAIFDSNSHLALDPEYKGKWLFHLDRMVHSFCNQKGWSRWKECRAIFWLLISRLRVAFKHGG